MSEYKLYYILYKKLIGPTPTLFTKNLVIGIYLMYIMYLMCVLVLISDNTAKEDQ